MGENYGEEIAYWYLRLNGFFPLTNFVLHGWPINGRYSADADILAIRLSSTREEIRGVQVRFDHDWFGDSGIDLDTQVVGLFVEVKTGRLTTRVRRNIQTSFSRERLLYGLNRIGLWQEDRITDLMQELAVNPLVRDPESKSTVAKVLMSDEDIPAAEQHQYLHLRTSDALSFIRNRIADFYDAKRGDRMFFGSSLMQFLISQGG